jgi:hypothetical protein
LLLNGRRLFFAGKEGSLDKMYQMVSFAKEPSEKKDDNGCGYRPLGIVSGLPNILCLAACGSDRGGDPPCPR